MIAFEESKTRINLMRAFAGESQARNRYTFAAALARQNRLEVVARTFDFTAGQEKEHAEIFYQFLAPMNGSNILMDAGFPVNTEQNVPAQLRAAVHNETEECNTAYLEFSRIALEEGFGRIADAFAAIATIEGTHAQRFTRFADALESGELFSIRGETAWLCLNCGHVHFGPEAPKACPVCSHDQGYMIRADLKPFVC